jgi:hypothetical protein
MTRVRFALWTAAALVLAGCTDHRDPPVQSAQRETILETTATVLAVDQTTREVRLRPATGEELTVVAGPEVRNLPQLEAGDVVRLTYYEAVAARMAEPGAAGPTTATVVAGRAPEGGKPAGMVGTTVDMVVEFLGYDAQTGVATFKTPEGVTQRVEVSPAMRDFAAARRPGDRVAVQITSAVAVSIVETGT